MEKEEFEIIKELKTWLEGYVNYTEKKIENMKRVVPDHINIKFFMGGIHMSKMILNKIEELEKTKNQEKFRNFKIPKISKEKIKKNK